MPLKITTTIEETRRVIAATRAAGRTIGFVPTMGALHAGHASLMESARLDLNFVVVSIFVNPKQFGPTEDLALYPRPFERDVQICTDQGVDLLFHPAPEEMYPQSFYTTVEVHDLQDVLCGASRPGHFRGVATVVLKLFNIVQPDRAYFGQKDAQQARLLLQMIHDLNVPVELKICPIQREPDGLALSSRNVYLDADQRRHATVLYHALEAMQDRIEEGEERTEPLLKLAKSMIAATPGARLDYAAIVNLDNLQPLDVLRGKVLIALAVYFGKTRLIDNAILQLPA